MGRRHFDRNLPLLLAVVLVVLVAESHQIPLEFRRRLAQVNSTAELMSKFVRNKAQVSLVVPAQADDELDATKLSCMPRPTLVDIPSDSDPNVVFYPSCVELARCGGCCGDGRLACTPLSTLRKQKTVMKYVYSSEFSDLLLVGHTNVMVEDHVTCDCRCRVTPDECHPTNQFYDEDACQCRCKDTKDAKSCGKSKYWNDQLCRCTCPEVIDCFEDEVYDFSSCRCQLRIQVLPAASDVMKNRDAAQISEPEK